jgi:hypothetical protein
LTSRQGHDHNEGKRVTEVKTSEMNGRVTDFGECEYIQSFSSNELARLTLVPPIPSLNTDVMTHASSCTRCAEVIVNAQRVWLAEHPEEAPSPEMVEALRVLIRSRLNRRA